MCFFLFLSFFKFIFIQKIKLLGFFLPSHSLQSPVLISPIKYTLQLLPPFICSLTVFFHQLIPFSRSAKLGHCTMRFFCRFFSKLICFKFLLFVLVSFDRPLLLSSLISYFSKERGEQLFFCFLPSFEKKEDEREKSSCSSSWFFLALN